MHPVSEDFLKAIQSNSRSYYWNGTITTVQGTVYEFNEQDILKGSGYISSQCCGGNEIELGTVYASEMGISLFSDIDRYALPNAKIELFFHLKLENGEYESIPMGIYEVSEANRKRKCLEIKAYDYMLRFDKFFPSTTTIGTAFEIMSLCCRGCNVEMAQTQEEIESLPNGKETVSIYTENDIETYRDVLYYLGQILGGFFCINRTGKLELRQYQDKAAIDISNLHRFSSSFSDYITRYTAISATNIKTQTVEYFALEKDDGLTMNLGANPFLQYGLDETRKRLCEKILHSISVFEYVPFEAETIGNPALDIGDAVSFSGGQADQKKLSCITHSQYRIGGRQSLRCVGKNARLSAAKSKNDKNLVGLMNQISMGKVGFFVFTNAQEIAVSYAEIIVADIDFTAKETTQAEFLAQIVLNIDSVQVARELSAVGEFELPADGPENKPGKVKAAVPLVLYEDGKTIVRVKYLLNGIEIGSFHPVETYFSGEHLLSLYYPLSRILPNLMNNFKVALRAENGTALIETGNCIATISGQGLAAGESKEWDGTIEISETMNKVRMEKSLGLPVMKETIHDELQKPKPVGMKDAVSKIILSGFSVDFNNGG